jgi:hypothetical protein
MGKPRGSIGNIENKKKIKSGYRVIMSPPGEEDQYYQTFKFADYDNDEEATLRKAEEFRYEQSELWGTTRNKLRYLDRDTIEVKLTQDKVMKTDAKFIDEVQKYTLETKAKQEDGKIRYYAVCDNKGHTFPFTNLICDFISIKYINADPLDLRLVNLKEMRNLDKAANKVNIDNSYEDKLPVFNTNDKMTLYNKHLCKCACCTNILVQMNADSFDNVKYNSEIYNILNPGSIKLNNQIYKKPLAYDSEIRVRERIRLFLEFKKLVESKQGKVISNDPLSYIDAHEKIPIMCKNEHPFKCCLNNLQKGRWCPHCDLHTGELISKCAIEFLLQEQFIKIRPDWLKNESGNNLEIDAYCDKLKLGLEYQGIQHYKYVQHFHRTMENFEKRKRYDELKKKLCEENDVTLIEVPYTVQEKDICRNIYNKLIALGFQIPEDQVDKFNINDIYDVDTKTEELRKKIESRGGKLMEGQYLFLDSIITFMCDKGHLYTTKVKYVLYGSWCATCGYVVDDDRKNKISLKMIERFKTEEGKKEKQLSHAKRSETMKKQKEEIRANITHKKCTKPECELKGQLQPVDNFCKKAAAVDGYQSWCKTCTLLNKKKVRLV